jgi:membrane fusion protein, multidrug efflux system
MLCLFRARLKFSPKSLCLTLLSFTLLSCQGEADNALTSVAEPPVTPVRVSTIALSQQPDLLHFASVTRVRQRANLTFQVSGVLRERHVEIGQLIQPGQLLATLHNPALLPARDAAAAALAQLETEKAQSERELHRLETLYDRQVVSLQDLEQLRTRTEGLDSAITSARASLNQAQQLLNESRLTAPFAGNVESVLLEPGEYVQTGQPVMRVSSSHGLEAEIGIPAHLQTNLSLGQILQVYLPISGLTTSGQVIDIGIGNTSDTALYPVVIALESDRVKTGESIEVSIPQHQQPQLLVPLTAVMRSADGLTVFVVENDTVRRTPVTVLRIRGEHAVLPQDNLPVGTKLVYAGLTRLADGDRIRVLP